MSDHNAFKDPHRDQRIYGLRLLIAGGLVLLGMMVLLGRYYYLQVTQHEVYATQSERNRVHVQPVSPTRGLIYDRNGVLLADNMPSFTLSVVKERVEDMAALLANIDQLVGLDATEIERFEKLLSRRRPYEATPLKFNLSEREQGILAVNQFRLEGIEINAELVRFYPFGELFAHVIGYVGRINDAEIQKLDPKVYAGTDVIGKNGLEAQYESQLLGTVGYEHVETNARGRVMRVLERFEPESGADLVLNMDVRLQQAAYDAVAGERAGVVVIEVETGGILAMASSPSYDPNLFVTGISQANYSALINSPDRPLYDRTLRGLYPPGSTVKPLYGLIGLEERVITPQTKIRDPGYYQLEGNTHKYRDWKKWGHGNAVDLVTAVEQSCDVFFYNLGFKTGIDALSRHAEQFGLGHETGIDLPGEKAGIMPSKAWKRGARGESWYHGDTINTSIGQGYMLTTPLQLAVMTSRIASRGVAITPRVVHAIDDVPLQPPESTKLNYRAENWDSVFESMKAVVHNPRGTAGIIRKDLNYTIAGKTGTAQVVGIAQNEKYDESKLDKRHWDHALFVAFAPVENPKVAVGLIVENGQHGSSAAAPVARKIFDAYMRYYESPESLAARGETAAVEDVH